MTSDTVKAIEAILDAHPAPPGWQWLAEDGGARVTYDDSACRFRLARWPLNRKKPIYIVGCVSHGDPGAMVKVADAEATATVQLARQETARWAWLRETYPDPDDKVTIRLEDPRLARLFECGMYITGMMIVKVDLGEGSFTIQVPE